MADTQDLTTALAMAKVDTFLTACSDFEAGLAQFCCRLKALSGTGWTWDLNEAPDFAFAWDKDDLHAAAATAFPADVEAVDALIAAASDAAQRLAEFHVNPHGLRGFITDAERQRVGDLPVRIDEAFDRFAHCCAVAVVLQPGHRVSAN